MVLAMLLLEEDDKGDSKEEKRPSVLTRSSFSLFFATWFLYCGRDAFHRIRLLR